MAGHGSIPTYVNSRLIQLECGSAGPSGPGVTRVRRHWMVGMPQRPFRRSRLAVVALTAASLMAAFVVTAGPTQAATSTETAIASAVLTQLNAERHAHALPALRMNVYLVKSARGHNLMMAKYNTMSHQLPGEPTFTTRITNAGYHWSYAGENVAWNSAMTQAGALALQTMMYNEVAPNNGHRLNILSTHYKDIGVDVLLDSTHHKLWLTEDFASPS